MNANHQIVIKFIEENILSRFKCPTKIVIYNGKAFKFVELVKFSNHYNTKLVHSTPYYPQGNGLE